eukprot:m.142505 g.142505  ORF g.142505 m.142505 type:complete len:362 (-) comp16716_c0_seq2:482-1567(-)
MAVVVAAVDAREAVALVPEHPDAGDDGQDGGNDEQVVEEAGAALLGVVKLVGKVHGAGHHHAEKGHVEEGHAHARLLLLADSQRAEGQHVQQLEAQRQRAAEHGAGVKGHHSHVLGHVEQQAEQQHDGEDNRRRDQVAAEGVDEVLRQVQRRRDRGQLRVRPPVDGDGHAHAAAGRESDDRANRGELALPPGGQPAGEQRHGGPDEAEPCAGEQLAVRVLVGAGEEVVLDVVVVGEAVGVGGGPGLAHGVALGVDEEDEGGDAEEADAHDAWRLCAAADDDEQGKDPHEDVAEDGARVCARAVRRRVEPVHVVPQQRTARRRRQERDHKPAILQNSRRGGRHGDENSQRQGQAYNVGGCEM